MPRSTNSGAKVPKRLLVTGNSAAAEFLNGYYQHVPPDHDLLHETVRGALSESCIASGFFYVHQRNRSSTGRAVCIVQDGEEFFIGNWHEETEDFFYLPSNKKGSNAIDQRWVRCRRHTHVACRDDLTSATDNVRVEDASQRASQTEVHMAALLTQSGMHRDCLFHREGEASEEETAEEGANEAEGLDGEEEAEEDDEKEEGEEEKEEEDESEGGTGGEEGEEEGEAAEEDATGPKEGEDPGGEAVGGRQQETGVATRGKGKREGQLSVAAAARQSSAKEPLKVGDYAVYTHLDDQTHIVKILEITDVTRDGEDQRDVIVEHTRPDKAQQTVKLAEVS